MSLGNKSLHPLPENLGLSQEIVALPDGAREQVRRRWLCPDTFLKSTVLWDQVFQDWGTADGVFAGAPMPEEWRIFPNAKLVEQRVMPISEGQARVFGGKAILEKVYEETPYVRASGGVQQVGELEYEDVTIVTHANEEPPERVGWAKVTQSYTADDGRKVWQVRYAQGEGEISRQTTRDWRQDATPDAWAKVRVTVTILTAAEVITPPVPAPLPDGVIIADGVQSQVEQGWRVWTLTYERIAGIVATAKEEDGEGAWYQTETRAWATFPTDATLDALYAYGWSRQHEPAGWVTVGVVEADFTDSKTGRELIHRADGSIQENIRVTVSAEGKSVPTTLALWKALPWPASSLGNTARTLAINLSCAWQRRGGLHLSVSWLRVPDNTGTVPTLVQWLHPGVVWLDGLTTMNIARTPPTTRTLPGTVEWNYGLIGDLTLTAPWQAKRWAHVYYSFRRGIPTGGSFDPGEDYYSQSMDFAGYIGTANASGTGPVTIEGQPAFNFVVAVGSDAPPITGTIVASADVSPKPYACGWRESDKVYVKFYEQRVERFEASALG